MAAKRSSEARTASRYYHQSPGGKFDDMKPGVLGSEVRQFLGIGVCSISCNSFLDCFSTFYRTGIFVSYALP